MKLTFLSILVVAHVLILKCSVNSHSSTEALKTRTSLNQSQKQQLHELYNDPEESGKTSLKNARNTHDGKHPHGHNQFAKIHGKPHHVSQPEGSSESDHSDLEGHGNFKSSTNKYTNKAGMQGRGILGSFVNIKRTEEPQAQGRGLPNILGKSKDKKGSKKKVSPGPKPTTSTTTAAPPITPRLEYVEPEPLSPDADCTLVTKDAAWVDQNRIRPCHYTTHNHPRQQARKKWSPETIKNDEADANMFKHLALFNIKHDLDFQEAGDDCSVDLHQEFMFQGAPAEEGKEPSKEPVDIEVMSFNRVWYKRLCSFFSYLECIPKNEVRKKQKYSSDGKIMILYIDSFSYQPTLNHILKDHGIKLGSKQDVNEGEYQLSFNDSGLDTTGLLRLKIGGRGPGKARHKSGPGGGRLDHRAFQGMSERMQHDGFPLDGTCVCSQKDPKYGNRRIMDYGMDFVEDEARPRWCVAAPGNLCGRVYFKRNIWPGQAFYEFSDHIGCPRKYNGEEYECVRWQKDPSAETTRKEFPNVITSTCEKKPKDPEIKQKTPRPSQRMKNSDISIFKEKTFSLIFLSIAAIYTV
ncbi:unnamed protein product [Orchesella dallaii]|uniref:Uncharacterized protein n=1 Tax=Orchesella dallaii TaxID=48710 RepID=A0ABP1PQV0_9HEXA